MNETREAGRELTGAEVVALADRARRGGLYQSDGRTRDGRAERALLRDGLLTIGGRGPYGPILYITDAGRAALAALSPQEEPRR